MSHHESSDPTFALQQEQEPNREEMFADESSIPILPYSNASSSSLSNLILSAAHELEIRSEVSSVLQSILGDIETAHSLRHQLSYHHTVSKLNDRYNTARDALDEYKATYHAMCQNRQEVAVAFVQQLWQLHDKLEQLERWRSENEEKVKAYETMMTIIMDNKEMHVNDSLSLGVENDIVQRFRIFMQNRSCHGVVLDEHDQIPPDSINTAELTTKPTHTSTAKEDASALQPSSTESLAVSSVDSTLHPLLSSSTANYHAASTDIGILSIDQLPTNLINLHEHTSTANHELQKSRSSQSLQDSTKSSIKEEYLNILESLPNKLLAIVFEYLSAYDILNVAQTSVSIYSKVDSLFFLGEDSHEGSQIDPIISDIGVIDAATMEESTTVRTLDLQDRNSPHQQSVPIHSTNDEKNISVEMIVTSHIHNSQVKDQDRSIEQMEKMTEFPTSPIGNKPDHAVTPTIAVLTSEPPSNKTYAELPIITTTPTVTTTRASSQSTSNSPPIPLYKREISDRPLSEMKGSTKTGGPLSQVFSILPTRKVAEHDTDNNTFGAIIKSIVTKKSDANVPSTDSTSDHISTVADSLASKLTPVELSAIISLRKERQKYMTEVQRLLIEKEDLLAKLESGESVKTFLLSKIDDLEKSVEAYSKELKASQLEVASDQEVIMFLDSRVQELEKSCKALQDEKNTAESTVEKIRNTTQKQLSVLGEMLTFERETFTEHEREWKSAKKVLVKEVKHCRAQILTLQTERDSYAEQATKYRDALLLQNSVGGNLREKR